MFSLQIYYHHSYIKLQKYALRKIQQYKPEINGIENNSERPTYFHCSNVQK